jgi:hypothetical protein
LGLAINELRTALRERNNERIYCYKDNFRIDNDALFALYLADESYPNFSHCPNFSR